MTATTTTTSTAGTIEEAGLARGASAIRARRHGRRSGSLRVAALLCGWLSGGGCGGRAPTTVTALPDVAHRPAAPLHEGDLVEYLPAAGLRWLLELRPRAIADDPTLSGVLAMFERERLEAFAAHTGVDLCRTEQAVVAGYAFGPVYLATVERTAPAERAFRSRLLLEPMAHRPHPDLAVHTGLLRSEPAVLVTVRDRFVAVAVGDPRPARAMQAYALGRLASPPALAGVALEALASSTPPALARWFAVGPFSEVRGASEQGLLAATTALAVTGEASGPGLVRVALRASGEYGIESGAAERLAASWHELAESVLGRFLGLDRPAGRPVIEAGEKLLALTVTLALEPLITGLRALVVAEAEELFELGAEPGRERGPTE